MTKLDELLAKVEAGTLWRCDVQSIINLKLNKDLVFQANHGSLDAAKALHDAVLPKWGWDVGINGRFFVRDWSVSPPSVHRGESTNPARAWLIAIIKALIAQEN